MPLSLYLIAHDDAEGVNCDLFVWANDPDEAVDLWRSSAEVGDRLRDTIPDKIFLVPLAPPDGPRVVHWHMDAGVKEVLAPKAEAVKALGI